MTFSKKKGCTLVTDSVMPPSTTSTSQNLHAHGLPARILTCHRIPLNPLLASESHEKSARLRNKMMGVTIWFDRPCLPRQARYPHPDPCIDRVVHSESATRRTYIQQFTCPRPIDKGIINQPSNQPTRNGWHCQHQHVNIHITLDASAVCSTTVGVSLFLWISPQFCSSVSTTSIRTTTTI